MQLSEEERASGMFIRSLGKSNIPPRYLACFLNRIIREWFAEKAQVTSFSIDARPPDEVVHLISAVENNVRQKWIQKAAATRAKNLERKKHKEEPEKQGWLEL